MNRESKDQKPKAKIVRVLLIENDPNDAELIQGMLTRSRGITFDLVRADRLSRGLELLDKGGIDIILLDLELQDSQGELETFTRVHNQAKDVPIVVLSGLEDEGLASKILQEAEDYLFKGEIAGSLLEHSMRYAIKYKKSEEKLQQTLDKLRKAMGGIIDAIALTVESRDPYTAGHQRRVADLARAIATEMGLLEDQIDGIRIAGLIHDLGKMSVPGEILNRPGLLNELEFKMIKFHAQIGYDILKGIDFPWPVARIALAHHERIDGSGYPNGLKGEEILLEARILAVADVVEAMSSHRPYRPALGIDDALDEISKNRGILYDPDVVDACLRVFLGKGYKFKV